MRLQIAVEDDVSGYGFLVFFWPVLLRGGGKRGRWERMGEAAERVCNAMQCSICWSQQFGLGQQDKRSGFGLPHAGKFDRFKDA